MNGVNSEDQGGTGIKAEQELKQVLKAKVRRIRTPHLASAQLGTL
jgi:hypothetical protein